LVCPSISASAVVGHRSTPTPPAALDGVKQVLLTDMRSGAHHDLVCGAVGQWVDLPIQDGGAYRSQLGGDRRQGTRLVIEGARESPE
jgi:hypothetical protein